MPGMNLFSLVARLTLDDDEYNQKVNQSVSKASTMGKALTKTVKGVSKAAGVAVAAAATAVTAIVKNAVDAYKEYEQLVGGVETLFGAQGMTLEEYAESVGKSVTAVRREYKIMEKTQQEVLNNANEAYKTAGMSANEYMESVMGFSASLIKSLDGDTTKAARLADMAMQDIADNSNKFGKYSAQELSNVYSALARGNFQTLDNLQLGYAGTKEGMEDLIRDAMKYDKSFKVVTKTTKNGSKQMIYSYADMVKAIHIVQNEMGITGTTAKEAEGTIQGSINMTKAAWQNLLVAIAGGGDLKKAINNLVDSGISAFRNIYPVVLKALSGVGEVIKQVAPIIAENLPQLVKDLLPKLLDAAVSLVMGIVKALPGIVQALFDAVGSLFDSLRDYLYEKNPELGNVFDNVVDRFEQAWESIKAFWDTYIKPAFENIISFFQNAFKGDWEAAWENIKSAFKHIWSGIVAWYTGLFRTAKELIESIEWKKLGEDIWNWITQAFKDIVDWFDKKWKDVKKAIEAINWKQVGENIWNWITNAFSDVIGWASRTFANIKDEINKIEWEQVGEDIWNWITQAFVDVVGWASRTFEAVKAKIAEVDWKQLGYDMWNLIKKAFALNADWHKNLFEKISAKISSIEWEKVGAAIWDSLVKKFNDAVKFFKDLFDGHNGDGKNVVDTIKAIDWKEVGEFIWKLIKTPFEPVVRIFKGFFEKAWTTIRDDIDWKQLGNDIWNWIKEKFDDVVTFFHDLFKEAWEKIKSIEWGEVGKAIWDKITNALEGIGTWLYNVFKTPINFIIDGVNHMIGGLEAGVNRVIRGINRALSFDWTIPNPFGPDKHIAWSPNLSTVSWKRVEKLATGGFLNEGQRAVVGEYRPEMLSVVNGHALVTPIGGIKPGDRMGNGDTYNTTINVYQQPGEDAVALADRIDEILAFKQNQRKAAFA